MSKRHAEQTEELQMAIALMREELMGVEERALMTSSINEARERQQLDTARLGQQACAHHGASPSPQVRAQLDALRLGQQAASREVAISRQEASDLRAELEQLRTALEAEGKFPTGAATGMRLPSVAEVRESLLTPQSAALGSALGSSSSQPDSSSTRPGSVVFIAGLVVFTEPSRRRRTGRARRRRRRWPGRTMSSLWPRRWLRWRRARHGARPQRPAGRRRRQRRRSRRRAVFC
jgi:hypothetical protein